MGLFTVGDVVLVPFPFADLTKFKKRPALVIAEAEFDNFILCQITSKANTSQRALRLNDRDFHEGKLPVESFIRPDKLFTIEPRIVETKLGHIHEAKLTLVKGAVKNLFS